MMLAFLVVAMTIGQSFTFTLPETRSVTKRDQTSSRSNTGSFEKKVSSPSALGMATWSNGEWEERCLILFTSMRYACLCS